MRYIALESRGIMGEVTIRQRHGKFHAIDNICTHRGGPLSEGELEGDEVTCPWHGAKFKVSTGEVLSPPAPQGVGSYKLRVNDPDIELEL
jgi:3-phenylpropionate/trans-cinnamate dioxygenase ferredoxin subunit